MLLFNSRCLSAEHEALASCRVTAQCFEYGRAAALALYFLIGKLDYRKIDGNQIADLMRDDGYSEAVV